jgi:hypothetical protein
MGSPGSAKKTGRTLLEKRRLKQERQATQAKRMRKSDRINAR